MNKLGKISGWSGLSFIIISLFIYFISPGNITQIYTVSGIGVTCALIYFISNREAVCIFLGLRQAKHGTNSVVMFLIVTAILVLINSIASRHKKRFDLTDAGIYSISPQTKKLLKGLKKDIKITGFFQTGSSNLIKFKDLLEGYKNESKHIRYDFIDPDRNPTITKQYGITNYGVSVLEAGKRETKIREISEEALTNALVKVTKEETKKIYFIEGHGENAVEDEERDGYSQAKQAIEGEGYDVEKLVLLQEGSIPEDASMVILAGPKKTLMKSETDLITAYLKKGGSVFFMVDPNEAPGMDDYLKEWGVKVGNNIIIDTISKLFGGDYTVPVVVVYPNHDITKDFPTPTFFPLARSVEPAEEQNDKLNVAILLETSDKSWGEVDTNSKEVRFDKGVDRTGPLTIGVAVTEPLLREKKEGEGFKLVVIGDSDFANNYYFSFSGNGDLFLNTVNWLMREENFITIRPKKKSFAPLTMTREQGVFLALLSLVIMPGSVIFLGVFSWWKRRRL